MKDVIDCAKKKLKNYVCVKDRKITLIVLI